LLKIAQRCRPAAFFPLHSHNLQREIMPAQRSAEVNAKLLDRIGRLVWPPEQRNNRLCHLGNRRENFKSAEYRKVAYAKRSLEEATISPQESCR
jgi:hypothetical protein